MSDIKPLNWNRKTLALTSQLSLGSQAFYAGRRWSIISPRSLHYDVSEWCLVAWNAQCTSMASRTAYSTWTPQKLSLFSGHYLRNRSTLDIGVLGYIGIVQHKEHSPEVLSIPPGTPSIYFILYFSCTCQQNATKYVEYNFQRLMWNSIISSAWWLMEG